MQPAPKLELSGVFSRCSFSDNRAEVRLTPFLFSRAPNARPVWSLVFLEPGFDVTAVQAHLGAEVDIEVFDQHAVVYDEWQGAQQTLGATQLTVNQVSFDDAELNAYVDALEANIQDLNSRLYTSTNKDTQGRAILRELLRRAEIKAAASDHLRERQAAAIAVLKRLQTHFGD